MPELQVKRLFFAIAISLIAISVGATYADDSPDYGNWRDVKDYTTRYDSNFMILQYEAYLGSYLLTGWNESIFKSSSTIVIFGNKRPAGNRGFQYVAQFDPIHYDLTLDGNKYKWFVKDGTFPHTSFSPFKAIFNRNGTVKHVYLSDNNALKKHRVYYKNTVMWNPWVPNYKGVNRTEREKSKQRSFDESLFFLHPLHPYGIEIRENGAVYTTSDDPTKSAYFQWEVDGGDIENCVFSPDGKYMAILSKSRRVSIFNLEKMATWRPGDTTFPAFDPPIEFEFDKNSVKDLVFLPDGKRILSGGNDKLLTVRNFHTGETLHTIPLLEAKVRCLALSPDGGIIAIGDNDEFVQMFAVENGQLLYQSPKLEKEVHLLRFHPLGLELTAGTKNRGYQPGWVYKFDLFDIPETQKIIAAWHSELLTNPTVSNNFSGAALTLQVIRETEQRYREKIARLDEHMATRVKNEATPKPKDEFETKLEYDNRIRQTNLAATDLKKQDLADKSAALEAAQSEIHRHLDHVFSFSGVSMTLGQYDPEKGEFPATVSAAFLGQTHTKEIRFRMDRQQARSLKKNWNSVRFVGQAKLRSVLIGPQPKAPRKKPTLAVRNRFDLIKLEMRDPTTRSYYAIDLMAPGPVYEVETSSPGFPPNLVASIVFEEPSGNNVLDPEEEGTIWVEVSNHGTGSAFDTSVFIEPRTLPNIRFTPPHFGEIGPGETRRTRIPLWADLDLQEGSSSLKFTVRAAEEFAAPPVSLSFPTSNHSPPQLELVDVGTEDWSKNGRIEPGEQAEITVRIQNMGYGYARDAEAKVSLGTHVNFAEGTSGVFKLGRLDPGEFRDFHFQVYTNTDAKELPINIDLSEGTGRYANLAIPLDLAFHIPLRTAREVVVTGRADETRRAIVKKQGLSVDVDDNVPHTKVSNPDAVAVVMGVFEQKYADVPQVRYAKRDAYVIRDYLIHTMGYDPENILPRDPDELMSTGTMKALLKDQLPATVKRGKSDVFVYYSGHGTPNTNTNSAFLVPWDCDPNRLSEHNSYDFKEFKADLAALEARSVILVVDACFSGQVGSGQQMLTNFSPIMMEINDPFAASTNMVLIASSAPEQVSNWYPSKRHGMFTYFFLKGLQGNADLDSDGNLTVMELESYLTDETEGVPYWSMREFQRLQVPVIAGDRSIVLLNLN